MTKPFLKFLGGKTSLLPLLEAQVPKHFGRYHEPFLGGGALFFRLQEQGRLTTAAVLSDVCAPLISTYSGIQNDPDSVADELREYQDNHSKAHFYGVRKSTIDCWTPAKFIYLNRTCFNGMYRQNSRGEFNVPFGSYKNPTICNEPVLHAASRALRGHKVMAGDFSSVQYRAEPGDLVYFDPPYVPDKADYFVDYVAGGFSMDQQELLAQTFEAMVARGVFVILSNSNVPWVQKRYGSYAQLQAIAPRSISAKVKGRKPAKELVIVGAPTA